MANFHVDNMFDCAYQCTSTACCTAFNYHQISRFADPGNCEIIGERSNSELVEKSSKYSIYEISEVLNMQCRFLSIMNFQVRLF